MIDSDSAYFAERAREERNAATRSTSDAARDVHLELAARYNELATSIVAHMSLISEPVEPVREPALSASFPPPARSRPRLSIVASASSVPAS